MYQVHGTIEIIFYIYNMLTPTRIAGVTLPHHVYNAAGVRCTSYDELDFLAMAPTGAILTKSCSMIQRAGNSLPTYWSNGIMSINANGLRNHGLQYYLDYVYIKEKPYIISTVEPECVAMIDDTSICDLIEYNISCPNVLSAFVEESQQDDILRGVIETTTLGVGLKVTALSTAESFIKFAEMIDRNGFKFVTSINSMPMGAIIEESRPVVSTGSGGIGGLSILPFSVANVVHHKRYLSEKIDVIAAGGVSTKEHIEMFRALGAAAVQVGTAFQDNINIFDTLI